MRRSSRSGVAALAVAGLVSTFGAVSVFTASSASAAVTDVVINEIESNGDTANGDWIELYNNGTTSVNLAGVKLADSDNTHVVTITSGTIAAKGYFTVRTDVATSGITTGDFGLGGADSARLYAPGATVGTTATIDSYTWSNHAATTYGRFPNGAGAKNGEDFVTTTASTRNAANSFAGSSNPDPSALQGVIVINEVESSSDAVKGNWIELRNTNAAGVADVNIGGAILSDNNNGHTLTIPAGTTLASGAVKAFVVEDPTGAGAFGLGPVDSARLFIAGTVDLATADPVDTQSWDTHSPTTYGLNSLGQFAVTSASTFDTANTFGGTVPTLAGKVVINEVESTGGSNGDFVELYNKSAAPVAIELAAITDADDTHVFSIPAGTPALAPGTYAVFRVDNPAVDGNFGLGNVDSARLFNAGTISIASTTPVDSYSWTAHAGNTWGRIPNGTGSFVNTSVASFGTPNS